MTKEAVIITSDHHINSTVGLAPPRINLDDGGTFIASPAQRWLWEGWLRFIEWADRLTEGYRTNTALVGDVGDLDTKRKSNQIITPNKATVLSMIGVVLEPLILISDTLRVTRGTPAHVGKSAWLEEEVASDYDITVPAAKGIYAHNQVRMNASGVRIDIAHHASMGSLYRTRKNAANFIAHDAMEDYAFEMGAPIPHLVIRAHNHRWADSYDNYPTRAICLPCWMLATEYIFRLGKYNGRADVGGVVVLCDNGEYEVHKFKWEPKKGNVWIKA